jgi:enamine deaminase RidA (YjgF/YER057c/UK114 family)
MPARARKVSSPEVAEPPPGTWSNCRVVGDQVFIAGMTARAGDFDSIQGGGAYEQARVIFAKIKLLMEAAGGTIDDVIKVNIFLKNISDREAVWKARREAFTGDFPVSTLLEVSALARPEMLVEVEAVGFIGSSGGRLRNDPGR